MVASKIQNTPEIKAFIRDNNHLFWWIKESEKENIDPRFLVEAVLNYGDEKDVKKLFDLLGLETVAAMFYRQSQKERNNYLKPIRHFFHLYFQRHVPGYPQSAAA